MLRAEYPYASMEKDQLMYLRNVEREQSQLEIKAIMQGRTDYERSSLSRLLPTGRKNLTPMLLCQPVK